jgi:MGT family glycosyltransferase
VMEQLLRLPRSLVLTSREFDFVPNGLPAHVQYVGPQLDDPAGLDAWNSASIATSAEPLVLVSLGSTYQRQEKTFDRAVEALGQLPVRGLATYAAIDPPAGPAPRNVTVIRSAPHGAVLPLASAVVCHGGLGTVMKALAHGLPLVVMPLGRDQNDNAARVEACGAGIRVSAGASPTRIARAVSRVLREPQFREQAQRMATIVARDVRDDRAVAALETLASGF